MKFDYFEYRISVHFIPALINYDATGLSDDEDAALNEWVESTDRRIQYWDVEDDSENFCKCDVTGLYSQCAIVRGYFKE